MKTILLLLALLAPMTAGGQLLFEYLRVHPENVAPDGPFLLTVEDWWQNGCQGRVRVDVSADRIQVEAVSEPLGDVACTEALVPFVDLVNPRASFNGEFSAEIAIDYVFVAPDGQRQTRAQRILAFGDGVNATSRVETGSWITNELESSGLFVDQQENLFTALLADYANGTAAWFYGAAAVEGNIVIADISRFGLIQCITAPCARAAPLESGTLLALLENENSLLVKYQNVLEARELEDRALRYRRFDLARSHPVDGVPDLVGEWIIGVSQGGNEGPASVFGAYEIAFLSNAPVGGLTTTTFGARDVNRLDDSTIPDFVIECQDARPVDGGLECRSTSLGLDERDCMGFFPFAAAGLQRVRGTALCGTVEGDFLMLKR
ncbi:MAG: hypothetical protein QNJ40_09700 [Xanthomonadales bacterium]|nr:hypothetical protein [Xanthomonadales bacterium]